MSYATLYPKLDRCYRLGRYVLQEMLTEIGVWAGQDRILCALDPHHITIQSELSRRLCMEERTLHRSLKYLEEKCYYIRRRESISDIRVKAIELTRFGRSAVDTIHYVYDRVGRLLCVGLSEAQISELIRLLELATLREYELRSRGPELRDYLDGVEFA